MAGPPAPFSIPKDIPKWEYEAWRRVLSKLSEQSAQLGSVGRGESPDGSGVPLVPLNDYFFLPGRAGGQVGYGGRSTGDDLTLSSTKDSTKGYIYLGYPTNIVAINEADKLVGINVSVPTAALHIRPGVSGVTTLVPSSDIDTKWDGPRNALQAPAGGSLASAVATNDGSTLWAGYSTAPLGQTPQQFGLNGTVTPDRIWTVNMYCCILSGTAVSGTLSFRLRDSNGDAFTYSATGTTTPGGLAGISTFPTFSLVTFTIDGTATPAASGETANSIQVGVVIDNPSGGYCAVTYIEITTGGDSNIARWDSSSEVQLGKVDSAGRFGIGTGATALSAMLTLLPDGAATIGQIIKGAASQSGRLLKLVDNSDVELGGFTHAGALFFISGAGAGKVLISDANGVGSWALASSLATRISHAWKINGPFFVDTTWDGTYVSDSAVTITSVKLWRGTAGTSGTTTVLLKKNGSTIATATVTSANGSNFTSSQDVSLAVAVDDKLTIDVSTVEGGTPLDLTLIIEGA